MTNGTRLGIITRITAGNVYVELPDVGPGYEYGPCLDTVGTLAVGDRVVTQALARDPDELVITGRIGGSDGTYVIPINRLPVAPSGNANPTQLVRADDARLSDARTPTAHQHDAADVTSGTLALARLPVAASGTSSATQLVRADDSRLGAIRVIGRYANTFSAIPFGGFPAGGTRYNPVLWSGITVPTGSLYATLHVTCDARSSTSGAQATYWMAAAINGGATYADLVTETHNNGGDVAVNLSANLSTEYDLTGATSLAVKFDGSALVGTVNTYFATIRVTFMGR